MLFADLVGFTSASEKRDAEETRELLSRYFDTCRRLIELYGGTVEKFIGDAVMAVWGTPVATEDDAERAVRAGLDLVAAVSALGDEVGAEELRARAGVLTGEAAVTIGAEAEGMVAGDLVNTASRIQSIAAPGSVYVGDATRRATEQTIAYEAAGSHELAGKGGLYPLFRALRVVSGARGSLKSEGLEAPFVGRDRELRLIKELFHASASDYAAHLVSIIGFAGIGKSRLAWEFFKYIDGIEQVTYWHRGRCLSYGEGVTYWALADMVRMRCRISEDEAQDSALEKLRAVLVEHVLDEEERRFVEPRVAHLLGLEERSRFEREDLFSAWRVFFERLAAVEPVTMVFEDMQWADDSLLDFIDYLLEWSRQHPIFVCTLARPELHERRPTWGAGRRSFTSLYLEPLDEGTMKELLDGLVPGLPEELRAQILERAEGVPLYAVETVRMMLDRGVLVQDGPVYRPAGPIASLEVPETLHALIAARLDGLEPEERRVLQDAAVLGKSFTRQALATLAGLEDPELEPLLRALTRKEILSVQADPRSPEHGQYSFVQDLLRHVAYETLSKQDRRMRHLAAARHLESAFADEDEIVEVVASHYLEAYRSASDAPDAVEIKVRARDMLARAGDRAASLAAAREAQRYFDQAAELADDEPAVQADLLERAGVLAYRGGSMSEARARLDRAISLHERLGNAHDAARAGVALADVDVADGRLGQASARFQALLPALEQSGASAELAATLASLGRMQALHGEVDAASENLERALLLAERLTLDGVFLDALVSKALLLCLYGRLGEARMLLEGAMEGARAGELPVWQRAANNVVDLFKQTEQYPQALELAEEIAERGRQRGYRESVATARSGAVFVLAELGLWREAVARIDEVDELQASEWARADLMAAVPVLCAQGAVEAAERILHEREWARDAEQPDPRASFAVAEAQLHAARNRPAEALAAAERALEHRTELGASNAYVKPAFAAALAAALELGDLARADDILASLDELDPGERTPSLDGQRARFHARLDALRGHDERVESQYLAAEAAFAGRGLVFHLAVTQLEHAEWLVAQDRTAEAEPLLIEARETFERLEAGPWLERLDAVRPGVEAVA